jgi:hypothetical protein
MIETPITRQYGITLSASENLDPIGLIKLEEEKEKCPFNTAPETPNSSIYPK